MSEREPPFPEEKQLLPHSWLATTLLASFKVFARNKQAFLFIFTFFILPLSILNFSLSHITTPLTNNIYRLEALATITYTRFEARQIQHESRENAISLFFLKSRFVIPSFILSLISTITAINAAFLSYHGRGITFLAALTLVKSAWKRVLTTSIVIYVLLLLYSLLNSLIAVVFHSTQLLMPLVIALGLGVEVYLMAVLGLGLVVSVLEDHYGWEAIRVGCGLMKGRRFCGWVLTALFSVISGFIGHWMEEMVRNEDVLGSSWWMTATGGWHIAGLLFFYGVEVLWGYAAMTVFHCECRKRHGAKGEDDGVLLVHV